LSSIINLFWCLKIGTEPNERQLGAVKPNEEKQKGTLNFLVATSRGTHANAQC